MQNKKFIELRKSKNFSQTRLAEELYVPVLTIRNWEQNKSIPSIDDMKKIAKILNVTEEFIVSIFEPAKTKVEKADEEEAKMYDFMLEWFWKCDKVEEFLQFTYIFSLCPTSGVVSYYDYVFPFTKVLANKNEFATMLADNTDNFIVLTNKNIINTKPVSTNYDVLTFDIEVNCPMFPTELKYSPNSFTQKIRVSFYNR